MAAPSTGGLRSWRPWLFLVLFVAPGIVGYVFLVNAVEFYGENTQTCTGAGRNRSCSTAEGKAQLDALFGGDVPDGYVSSYPMLWVARAIALLYAALVVGWIGWAIAKSIRQRAKRARRRRRKQQARSKQQPPGVDLSK